MEEPPSPLGPARACFSWSEHLPKMPHALEILFWVFIFDSLIIKVKIKVLSSNSYFIDRNYMCLVIVNYFKDKTEEPL